MNLLRAVGSLIALSFAAASAQEEPRTTSWASRGTDGVAFHCSAWFPATHDFARFAPVTVWFGERSEDVTKALVEQGFVVVAIVDGDVRAALARVRRECRIEQGGMHAVVGGVPERSIPVLLEHRADFQTITLFGDAAAKADLTALRRLPSRRVLAVAGSDPKAVASHLQKLHAERACPGAAGEVAKVLDDFHDAAANGDAARYFAILPDDAVFLGTDGTERWTGAEFRKAFAKYFERGSAWTYVCLRRSVDVDAGGAFAWFDETFDNEAYGECRGSGVMSKRDGKWVLRQYHLTVPVPNDVTRAVAARIRAFQDALATTTTTVVLVRHAEKTGPEADALSDVGRARAESLALALRDLPIAAVYSSSYRRAILTVAPAAAARALNVHDSPARDSKGLAARLAKEHSGETVLVCGHSNTIPEMLQELGVKETVTIGDDEYDRLFVVTIDPEGARLLSLRYAIEPQTLERERERGK